MYGVTARRTLTPRSSANGTSQTFSWTPSLFTIRWVGNLVSHGILVGRLQSRAQKILMNDPDVIAVTTVEF